MAKRWDFFTTYAVIIIVIHLATISVACKKWKDKDKHKDKEEDRNCERYDPCYDRCSDDYYGSGRRSNSYRGDRRGKHRRRQNCQPQRDCYYDDDDYDYDQCCESRSGKKGGKKEDKFWDRLMKKEKEKYKGKEKGKSKDKSKKKDKNRQQNCDQYESSCCEPSYYEDECCGGGESQTIVVKNGPAIIQTVIVDDEVYSKYCSGYYDNKNPLQRVYVNDEDQCSRSSPKYPNCEEECEPQTYRVVVKDPCTRKSYNQYPQYSSYY